MVQEQITNTKCFSGVYFALDTNIHAKRKNELKGVIAQHGGVVLDFITSKVCIYNNMINNYNIVMQ